MNVISRTIFVLSLLVLTGCPSPERAATGVGTAEPAGYVMYRQHCARCHGLEGQGMGRAFPPLVATEWVTGDEERLISLVMHGISGPLTIDAVTYDGVMPGFREQLSDEGAAVLLTWIRSAWGNEAPAISPSTVARVRAQGPKPMLSAPDLTTQAP